MGVMKLRQLKNDLPAHISDADYLKQLMVKDKLLDTIWTLEATQDKGQLVHCTLHGTGFILIANGMA